jgi:hypothetical protein
MADVLVVLFSFVIVLVIYCWRVRWYQDTFGEPKSKIQNLLGDKKERWWE